MRLVSAVDVLHQRGFAGALIGVAFAVRVQTADQFTIDIAQGLAGRLLRFRAACCHFGLTTIGLALATLCGLARGLFGAGALGHAFVDTPQELLGRFGAVIFQDLITEYMANDGFRHS